MRFKVVWREGWAYAHGTDPKGRRIRRALKTQDRRRAEELRASLEATLWRQDLYGVKAVVTFDQAALAYAEDGGDVTFIVKIAEQLNGMRLQDITPRMVREAARRAYPNHANATMNRQGITPARAVINYAHQQGWCPPIKVQAFPIERPRRKAVGPEYLARLQPHLLDRVFALMLFLNTTGRRIGEAIALEPHHVDLNRATAHIPKTKNGEPADVALAPLLVAMLHDLPSRHGRVFGYTDRRKVYPVLRRACAKAGVEYLGTHQPGRHSFATALEKQGWSSKAIADAGGWKSVRLVDETYIHPDNSGARATDLIGAKLTQALSGKKASR